MSELPAASSLSFPDSSTTDVDILICGGGLAGLTLARQLRLEHPRLRITVVERLARPLPESCHKVGESSVELASQYLESLGLTDYLLSRQLVKFGLRFFPGGGHLPVDQRYELGPGSEPVVRSYQLDRGRFEQDLRDMCEAQGISLVEGAIVRNVELGTGGAAHRVTFDRRGDMTTLTTRWVVDASGRNAILKKQMKTARGTNHPANAGWFRIAEKVDTSTFSQSASWLGVHGGDRRWWSTNHFMGRGYWVWLIPLANDRTSVGIVTHGDVHEFERVRTHENAMAFLREFEPHIARHLEDCKPLDYRCLNGYSHSIARCWSPERWAIVGEAGAFVDPLYSPGSDFIAFANCFTAQLIREDLEGQELEARCMQYNAQYRSLVNGAVALFRGAADVYGHPHALAAKVFWDNFSYWSFPCQYYQQNLFRLRGEVHDEIAGMGARIVELSECVQSLVRVWAKRHPVTDFSRVFMGLPAFPSVPVDAHLALQRRMSVDEAMDYLRMRVNQAEALVGEYIVRTAIQFGPGEGLAILEASGFPQWNVRLPADRIAAESTKGLARRRALGTVARDIERNLGRVEPHPEWHTALEQLYRGRAVVPTDAAVDAEPA